MSIFVVTLSEWFPPGDDQYETAFSLVSYTRCLACGDKPNWKKAIAPHSIPWGYGYIWCDFKCYHSGKIAKPDKRRQRRLNRQMKKLTDSYVVLLP